MLNTFFTNQLNTNDLYINQIDRNEVYNGSSDFYIAVRAGTGVEGDEDCYYPTIYFRFWVLTSNGKWAYKAFFKDEQFPSERLSYNQIPESHLSIGWAFGNNDDTDIFPDSYVYEFFNSDIVYYSIDIV